MNTHKVTCYAVPVKAGIPLQRLVDELAGNSLLKAAGNCSIVFNEVREGVLLQSPDPRILCLIREIIHAVIINSRNGDIHIAAVNKEGRMELKVQERNNYNGLALSSSISTLSGDVNSAGAALEISGSRQRVITVIFTFPDRRAA